MPPVKERLVLDAYPFTQSSFEIFLFCTFVDIEIIHIAGNSICSSPIFNTVFVGFQWHSLFHRCASLTFYHCFVDALVRCLRSKLVECCLQTLNHFSHVVSFSCSSWLSRCIKIQFWVKKHEAVPGYSIRNGFVSYGFVARPIHYHVRHTVVWHHK